MLASLLKLWETASLLPLQPRCICSLFHSLLPLLLLRLLAYHQDLLTLSSVEFHQVYLFHHCYIIHIYNYRMYLRLLTLVLIIAMLGKCCPRTSSL